MLLFGALFAAFENVDFRRSIFSSVYFWHGVVFASIFNVAVIYAIIHAPDWMWMYYLTDVKNSPQELVYIFIFLYYLPYALGFYLGLDLKRMGMGLWLLLVLSLGGAEAWIIIHLFDRYAVVGTTQEYLEGTAISLFSPDNPLGPVLNGSVALMIIYYLVVAFLSRRRKKLTLSV